MTKPTTHVLLVCDKSGSMATLADDVRGGFNTYIDGLKGDDGARYRVTAALFDQDYQPLCVASKLRDVPRLDGTNYRPSGMTALLDAVGRTITDFEAATELGDGDRVLLVVQTDGHENTSREYTTTQVAAMVKEREAGGRWSCIFLGAGIDAWGQAQHLGFAAANTVSTAATSDGTRSTYDGLTKATRAYSRGGTGAEVSGIVADAAGDSTGGAA